MLGAIAGDVIGSVYEGRPVKTTHFPLFAPDAHFTDDSVLTVATAEVLLDGGAYADAYRRYYRAYPDRGYGARFRQWAASGSVEPYFSYGNGSAMRVSPVGWARDDLPAVLAEAEKSAAATHNHPEGIKGAQATAAAVFLARSGERKETIRSYLSEQFGYSLDRPLAAIRPGYTFDASCQGSVPESLIAFFEADDFEGTIRNAISLGGDADTMACIAGGVAEAFFGSVPETISRQVVALLPESWTSLLRRFHQRFGPQAAPLG